MRGLPKVDCDKARNTVRLLSPGEQFDNTGYTLIADGQIYKIPDWDKNKATEPYLYTVLNTFLDDKLEIELVDTDQGTEWFLRNKTEKEIHFVLLPWTYACDFQIHQDNVNPALSIGENKVVEFCLSRDPIPITATYDRYRQSITAAGPEGFLVETKDPAGNVMGSGVFGADGAVTYSIDEGLLPDETLIETSGKDLTAVQHELVASCKFLYEAANSGYRAEVSVYQDGSVPVGEVYIDWGDGTQQEVFIASKKDKSFTGYQHTYELPGNYVLSVRVKGEQFVVSPGNHHKLLDWGRPENYVILNKGGFFYEVVPSDISPLITDCSRLFLGCSAFNQSIDHWNMSNVTSVHNMFNGCSLFNQPLNSWDTSNFESLSSMFVDAVAFNQPLNNWNLESVTSMNSVFERASTFNQDISSWKTSLVKSMGSMFKDASSFNQDLSGWCVPLISSEPRQFNEGGILTPEQMPVWGTCPNP